MSRPTRSHVVKGWVFIGVLVLIPVACFGAQLYFADPFERYFALGILAVIVAFWCGVYYGDTAK